MQIDGRDRQVQRGRQAIRQPAYTSGGIESRKFAINYHARGNSRKCYGVPASTGRELPRLNPGTVFPQWAEDYAEHQHHHYLCENVLPYWAMGRMWRKGAERVRHNRWKKGETDSLPERQNTPSDLGGSFIRDGHRGIAAQREIRQNGPGSPEAPALRYPLDGAKPAHRRQFRLPSVKSPAFQDCLAEGEGFELSLPSSNGWETNLLIPHALPDSRLWRTPSIVVIGARAPCHKHAEFRHGAQFGRFEIAPRGPTAVIAIGRASRSADGL